MKKKNNNWTTVFLVLLLLAGVSLLLYPSLSDYWNSMHQTRAIASYAETVSQLDTAQYDEMWKAAQDYNRSLAQRETAFALTDEQKAAYESLLDVSGLGVMGYIEIPEIDCSLPIYHGTEVEPSRGRGGDALCAFRAPGASELEAVYQSR